MIPFNKPYLEGKELDYIAQAVSSGKISGDGLFTKKCHSIIESKFGFEKVLLTTSCTDALEMAAILLEVQPGDEVIAPSYTFVSTVNSFILRGAKIVFADSCEDNPNIDPREIRRLISSRTKVIVVVHYAGVPCDMDEIMQIAEEYKIPVVEDAAQAIDAYYKGRPLGSFGDLATFSFHETKNIIAGEGGALVINDPSLFERAEIIREKGTNRSSFFRGEVNKYGWVDIGSSFLPSDIIAAYLYRQLEVLDEIQARRRAIWKKYFETLMNGASQGWYQIPSAGCGNAHMFYILCRSFEERSELILYLKAQGVMAVFHYLCLHESDYFRKFHDGRAMKNCKKFEETLLRLPLFYELRNEQIVYIANCINKFFSMKSV